MTSSLPVRSIEGRIPFRSIHPVTLPVAGSTRAICSLCQILAQISPFTHSSSLSCDTGVPWSVTVIVFCTANVAGSRHTSDDVPLLIMMAVPSVVSPHPSPSYVNSPVRVKRFQSYTNALPLVYVSWNSCSPSSTIPSPKCGASRSC